MNKKSTMIRECRFGIAVAMTALLGLVSGCIGFKTGPVETIVKSREPIKKECKLQTNNGITAKLTPDRGQMFMELWWWNKRAVTTTVREHKKDVILGTTRIGLFPGVGTSTVGVGFDLFVILLGNVVFVGIPTISSLFVGPFEDYSSYRESLSPAGLIGTCQFLDSKNPKELKSFFSEVQDQSVEEEPIQLTTFDVEIDGKVFRGENGIAHVGSIVGDKTALDVKVISFVPPEGFATNDVSSIFGSSFKVKVPSEAELAALAEKQRLAAEARAAQEQAIQAADAAAEAARQQAALAVVNATVQGINAAAAANASAPARIPSTPTVPAKVSTPTTTHSTYQPKTIPKYTIVPRAPSFGLSNGTSSDSGTRYKTGLQRVR